jgi:hypothetical protein
MKQPIHAKIIDISPEMAAVFLEKNTGNRPVRKNVVDRYADEMKSGQWKATHQGIAFDINGRLVDGQHRLMGIMKADVTVKMMVTYNVEPDTFAVLDQGAKRNPSDILGGSPRVAEVTSLAARLLSNNRNPSPELLQALHPILAPTVSELIAGTAHAIYFSSAPMKLAAALLILAGEDKNYVRNLYAQLCRGDVEGLPPIAQALLKHRLRNQIRAIDKNETLSMGLTVFSRRNEHSKNMRGANAAGAAAWARDMINSHLERAAAAA